jgi:hypothetical protein
VNHFPRMVYKLKILGTFRYLFFQFFFDKISVFCDLLVSLLKELLISNSFKNYLSIEPTLKESCCSKNNSVKANHVQ